MKNLLIYTWLMLLAVVVGALFWYNDYQYKIPTPMPVGYKAVSNGSVISLPASIQFKNNKPVLLHFYNPDCPCSRFNLQHVKSLVKAYANKVNFAVVIVSSKNYRVQDIQRQFNFEVPVIKDASLALACGVYSTPQAVILTANRQLHYRGNYNSSRYCTNKKTEYARQALHNLLHHTPIVNIPLATIAYGCRLDNLNYNNNAVQ